MIEPHETRHTLLMNRRGFGGLLAAGMAAVAFPARAALKARWLQEAAGAPRAVR